MACDILSISITSMASESTFSAGGRVIDPYRASLATGTVKMLLCRGDYVCALHGLKKGSDVSEICLFMFSYLWAPAPEDERFARRVATRIFEMDDPRNREFA
ncbi:hypothetical protein RHMOL_Rhmol03G0128200 [Rhododendron molle]|nr:hypothetical protein RHMOL_Rhmol03G0128200 [Rhododendron molle]